MKLQIDGQQWRLRIDEDELVRLREGRALDSVSHLPDGAAFSFSLALLPAAQATLQRRGDSWSFALPVERVEAYVQQLPSRKGLEFVLPAGAAVEWRLLFEVDVRDSVSRRGVPQRPR